MSEPQEVKPFHDDPLLAEAWAWMEDCGIVREEDTQYALEGKVTAHEIIVNMDHHYEGGWAQFKIDSSPLEVWSVYSRIESVGGKVQVVVEKSNFGNTRSTRIN